MRSCGARRGLEAQAALIGPTERLMGGCNNEAAGGELSRDRGRQGSLSVLVQRRRRFVEQRKRAPRQQQSGERQAAFLTRREVGRRDVFELGEAEIRERGIYRSGPAEITLPEPRVLRDGQRRIHGVDMTYVVTQFAKALLGPVTLQP